jgi:hypothetical protein
MLQVSRKVQQDMVLPVLVWEKNFIGLMRADNSLTHNEKVAKFKGNFFNLSHPSNIEQKEHYVMVAHTVLARIAEKLPSLEWIGKVFPKSHEHPHKATASVKSSLHVEPTLNMSEMDHSSMLVILDTLLMKRLSLLAQRLEGEEKEVYSAALLNVKSVGATNQELKDAEAIINAVVDRFGGMLAWGDQLTVKKALEAVGSRKNDWTRLEQLAYIAMFMLGDLHIIMAMVCKSFRALMPIETSENRGTFGSLASILMRSHRISNKEAKIKKSGNFEEHSNFMITVGSTLLEEALERYYAKLAVEGVVIEQTVAGARNFLDSFLTDSKIQLWWDPAAEELTFYDNAEEYAVSAATRALVLMVFKHAVKYGDATCIRTIHKVLAILFQFSSTNMNSQYGPSLMNECLDYEGLSSMDKMRADSMITVSMIGVEGKNIAVDCMCEHKVGGCKCLMDRFTTSFDLNVVERAMKAQNTVLQMTDYLLDSVCREDLKTGGGNSVIYFKEEEKAAIKKELRKLSPLEDPQGRDKVEYSFRVRGPWKGLTMAKVNRVVQHKAGLYDLERGRIE